MGCPSAGGVACFPGMFQAKAQRFARDLASSTIARALALSLLLHFVGIAGAELGRKLGWWDRSLLQSLRSTIPEEMQKMAEQRREQQAQQEVPLLFVQVDPAQAAAEAPENAKYYSSQNTVAANPEPAATEAETPKIEGEQEVVPQTLDPGEANPEPVAPPPQPQPQPQREVMQPAPKPQPQPEAPSQESEPEGETQMARATPQPEPAPSPTPADQPSMVQRERPRTLREARARRGLESPRMRQEGGTQKASLVPSLDVKATPFGTYDGAFIAAVQARWFSLIDQRRLVRSEAGKVVLDFRLHHDGRITDLQVVEATVSDTLAWMCERAILDPAPYAAFPSDLRRMLREDYRDVRFTFYYHN